MSNRVTDTERKTYYRSERFYCLGGQWFFLCREGNEIGPFPSQEEAEVALMSYLKKQESTL